MRIGVTACLGLLLLLLAACGLPPSVFRGDHSDALLTAPPLAQAAGGGLWVAPMFGAPAETAPDAELVRQLIVQGLVRREVPAGLDAAGSRAARLYGSVGEATPAGRGYVDVWWRLEGPDGALWDAFAVPTPLDFRTERPETQAAVAEVVDRLADMLGPAPVRAATVARIPIHVRPAVTTGFEDGRPLARAMTVALGRRGFQPGDLAGAEAIVQATASIEPAPGQPDAVFVRIRWAVLSPEGVELGAADQANVLPKTATADGLTAIAAEAADAAAGGVAAVIRRSSAGTTSAAPSTDKGAAPPQ